jgi:hypothetical protein
VTILLLTNNPHIIVLGAILMTNWEPLSVPATFDVVGSEVPKNRRTIAFAVQSIQKRVPKAIGPKLGAALFVAVGYWLNLVVALVCVALAVIVQLTLMSRMRPKADPVQVPIREIMRTMPADLRRLLRAEIFIRWGDWFARDFAVLYISFILTRRYGWGDDAGHGRQRHADGDHGDDGVGHLCAGGQMGRSIDVAKTVHWRDVSPVCAVSHHARAVAQGRGGRRPAGDAGTRPGLRPERPREIGEPARKALITTGFEPHVRARAVGVYWGLRSFAFFPAPIVAALLWSWIGPDNTFLIGGAIGLTGTILFSVKRLKRTVA